MLFWGIFYQIINPPRKDHDKKVLQHRVYVNTNYAFKSMGYRISILPIQLNICTALSNPSTEASSALTVTMISTTVTLWLQVIQSQLLVPEIHGYIANILPSYCKQKPLPDKRVFSLHIHHDMTQKDITTTTYVSCQYLIHRNW